MEFRSFGGGCPCGGTYELRLVIVQMQREGGEQLSIENVPQGVCDGCGSRVYHASILQRIESVMRVVRPAGLPRT